MKNLDYTLTIRDVPSEHQSRISRLLSALRNNIAVQGFGTLYKSEYSPMERWVVKMPLKRGQWCPVRGDFGSEQEAQKAINDWENQGHRNGYKAFRAFPETWEIQFWSDSRREWQKSFKNHSLYATQEIAQNVLDSGPKSRWLTYRVAKV